MNYPIHLPSDSHERAYKPYKNSLINEQFTWKNMFKLQNGRFMTLYIIKLYS